MVISSDTRLEIPVWGLTGLTNDALTRFWKLDYKGLLLVCKLKFEKKEFYDLLLIFQARSKSLCSEDNYKVWH